MLLDIDIVLIFSDSLRKARHKVLMSILINAVASME